MIIGKITTNEEAVVELEVFGLARRGKIEVVIDTGFTGHLLLPNDFINHLYSLVAWTQHRNSYSFISNNSICCAVKSHSIPNRVENRLPTETFSSSLGSSLYNPSP